MNNPFNTLTELIEPVPDVYLPIVGIVGALVLVAITLGIQKLCRFSPNLVPTGKFKE
jgi:hypothetical protein